MGKWLFLVVLCSPLISTGQVEKVDSLVRVLENQKLAGKEHYQSTLQLLQQAFSNVVDGTYPLKDNHGEEVKEWIDEATTWAESEGTARQLYQIQSAEVRHYVLTNEVHKAIRLGHELVKDPRFEQEADLVVLLSEIYKFLGYYPEYIRLIPFKYSLLRAQKDPEGAPYKELGDLGTAYYKMKQYAQARELYRSAIAQMDEKENGLFVSSFYNNMGLSFTREQQEDSARFYFQKALDVLERTLSSPDAGDTVYYDHFRNVILANKAELLFETGPYDVLERALKREVRSGKVVWEKHIYLDAWNKLGKLHFYKKQYDSALVYLDRSLVEINELRNHELLLFNLEWRAKTWLAQGNALEANKTFALKRHLEDSLETTRARDRLEIATVLYETNKKEMEIQQQQVKIAEGKSELAAQEARKVIYGAISIVMLVLLTLIFFVFKKVKQQRDIASKALSQRELMLKELHHRVKNNLQIVTSLLQSQETRSDDSKFRKLMQEGQLRIRSIAMIHEKLYKAPEIGDVMLHEYLPDLARHITASHTEARSHTGLQLKVPEISVQMDIAVSVGLIFNELLTNCYKYAFGPGDSGKIEVEVLPKAGDRLELSVSDNGRGLPVNFDLQNLSSLGLTMVQGLAWQLNGQLIIPPGKQGTTVRVEFSRQVPATATTPEA